MTGTSDDVRVDAAPAAPGAASTHLSAVRDFDRFLGDPREAGAVVSTVRSLELDERSAFPAEEIAAVDRFGLQRWYVPAAHGGRLTDALEPLLMIRHLARRDFTVAAVHGKTFLGAICAWVAGGETTGRMAELAGSGAPVSWGLTERGRGSDLSRSTTAAAVGDARVRVDGGKWPINNAVRCRAMTVLARTDDRPGPRSLSLVLVDKHEADSATISYEPKVRAHGLRGANLAGIRFEGTVVGRSSVIGPVGHGLEIVLKSLQLTRPFTTALSMGAADQALAIALETAATERVGGRPLADLPIARRALADAVADALLTEILMFTGVRCAHAAPDEMALVSALVKFLGPDTTDLLFRDLSRFLGARAQVVGLAGVDEIEPALAGAFQKAARDSRVVGIFDGNSVVNLNMIVNEIPNLLRPADPPVLDEVLALLRPEVRFDALPTGSLRLVTRQGSRLLRALPQLVDAAAGAGAPLEVLAPARFVAAEYAAALAQADGLPRQSQPDPLAFHLAERIALAFGGASALAFWLARRGAVPAPLGVDDAWIAAVLQRVAQRLGGPAVDPDIADAVTGAALRVSGPVTVLPSWIGAAA
ncbi:acyl-CoA dehydrogenase family protein [Microbacterium hominis]|uniref:Acyl-CoA dehydrogenase family protein n=1 Tax=Microbacterium hominis TaxID=162426 RepID=A0A7D4PV75_9MICO|nr:acyl-CoA dehydrogenase family protein [Microbacterium hominis]QKJ20293.1 acyl-CoA dehydrogenase family protein [Microbacterium hominis]